VTNPYEHNPQGAALEQVGQGMGQGPLQEILMEIARRALMQKQSGFNPATHPSVRAEPAVEFGQIAQPGGDVLYSNPGDPPTGALIDRTGLAGSIPHHIFKAILPGFAPALVKASGSAAAGAGPTAGLMGAMGIAAKIAKDQQEREFQDRWKTTLQQQGVLPR